MSDSKMVCYQTSFHLVLTKRKNTASGLGTEDRIMDFQYSH